jgi:O-antigen ligase
MSRFKNSPRTVGASTVAASTVAASTVACSPQWLAPPPIQAATIPFKRSAICAADSSNIVGAIGFFLFCAFILSGYANDWAIKLIGNKAYISTITLVLLPLPWLLSGNALRGLQRPMGRWWAAFLVCLLLSTPFSVWKGGSAMLLWNYVPKNYLIFFYACTFVTSIRYCRYLMYVNVAGAIVLLLTCMKFGTTGDGSDERFRVPGSLFYSNSNEVGLALLLGVTSFLFLFFQPGMKMWFLGAAGTLFSVMYALKTGSRGCLVAAIAMFVMIFLFSRSKLKMAAVALPLIGLALLLVPSATVHRLLLFGTDTEAIQSDSDVAAIESRLQRQEMLRLSLKYTFTRPLFGVGPGQFAVAVAGDAAKEGTHAAWLGTHNSYTQVSSECGIPAFVCYCAVLVFCFQTNRRLYRQSRDNPALKDVASLSFCLLASTLVYAVSTFFFHIAYSGTLPALAGFSLALRLAAEPLLARQLPIARSNAL